jgi:hypothetical protein
MFIIGLIAGIILFALVDVATIYIIKYRSYKELKYKKEFLKNFIGGIS